MLPSPFYKPLTMDICKLNSWGPYKMVALSQGGKCAGGYSSGIARFIQWMSNLLVLFSGGR